MKKIINYIINGTGFGLRYLFTFSVIAALIFGFICKDLSKPLISYAQETADQLLPLKIENGKVVEPLNTIRKASLKFADGIEFQYPITINTTVDSLNPASLPDGTYLTRTALYTVSGSQTKITSLQQDTLDLPQGDYTEFFKKTVNYGILIVSIIALLCFFLILFVLSTFYSLTAWIIAKFFKRRAEFDLRMRLSACAVILFYTLAYLVGFTGSSLSGSLIFVLIIVFQGVFIYKGLPRQPLKEEV